MTCTATRMTRRLRAGCGSCWVGQPRRPPTVSARTSVWCSASWRRLVKIACDELHDDPADDDARDRLLLLLAAGDGGLAPRWPGRWLLAGWYPDPTAAAAYRFWDGRQWTSAVATVPVAAVPLAARRRGIGVSGTRRGRR